MDRLEKWAEGFESVCQANGVDPEALVKFAQVIPELVRSKFPLVLPSALIGGGIGAISGLIPRKKDKDLSPEEKKRLRMGRIAKHTAIGAAGGTLAGSLALNLRNYIEHQDNKDIVGKLNKTLTDTGQINKDLSQSKQEMASRIQDLSQSKQEMASRIQDLLQSEKGLKDKMPPNVPLEDADLKSLYNVFGKIYNGGPDLGKARALLKGIMENNNFKFLTPEDQHLIANLLSYPSPLNWYNNAPARVKDPEMEKYILSRLAPLEKRLSLAGREYAERGYNPKDSESIKKYWNIKPRGKQ